MKIIETNQVHGTEIITVTKKSENVQTCDGLVTTEKNLGLLAYGYDCAIISFSDKEKIGICHVSWRNLVDGIIEKMKEHFQKEMFCHISPFLHQFEIQRDECFERITQKFGMKFLSKNDSRLIFDFKSAIRNTLDHGGSNSIISIVSDPRSTENNLDLASFRRLKKKIPKVDQNKMLVYRDQINFIHNSFIEPGKTVPFREIGAGC